MQYRRDLPENIYGRTILSYTTNDKVEQALDIKEMWKSVFDTYIVHKKRVALKRTHQ